MCAGRGGCPAAGPAQPIWGRRDVRRRSRGVGGRGVRPGPGPGDRDGDGERERERERGGRGVPAASGAIGACG